METKTLPNAVELEQVVLGALLVDYNKLDNPTTQKTALNTFLSIRQRLRHLSIRSEKAKFLKRNHAHQLIPVL